MSDLTEAEIRAIQAEHGIHLEIRPDGVIRSIQPGNVPAPGARIVAVKGARTIHEAKNEIRLAAAAGKLTDEQLEQLEDAQPSAAGELRRALRRVREIK